MNINDFEKPEKHPFSMLLGYDRAYEKESVLVFILSKCIEVGAFVPVETRYHHPSMVSDGLLIETSDKRYKLTTKSIGLLYSQYATQKTGD